MPRNHFPCAAQTGGNPHGYQSPNDAADSRQLGTASSPMRAFSFMLAFAFILGGQSIAGSYEATNLPGVGTFAYSGSPVVTSAPQAVLIASR
jgi:hypothetical protein